MMDYCLLESQPIFPYVVLPAFGSSEEKVANALDEGGHLTSSLLLLLVFLSQEKGPS